MIRAALLLSAVVCFLQPFRASATGQAAERLVVGRDTMQLFALPLATADSAVLARLEKRLDELDASGSTACWRRCIGVWRLDKGRLWLERVATSYFPERSWFPNLQRDHAPVPAGSAERSAMARGIWCITNTMDLCGISNANDSTGRVVRIDRARLLSEKGSPVVSDPADPLLQAALRAFRSVSRWDAWWVGGAWKEQAYFIPLRRGGAVWKLQRKRP